MARKKLAKKSARKTARKTTKRTARKKKGGRKSRVRRPGAKRSRGSSRTKSAARSGTGTYAGISSDAVRKATGKTWPEWFTILDARGAERLDHKAIAEYLSTQRNVPPWWSQMVTVGYEQARGMRKKHGTKQGFSISASRVMAAPISASWRAFDDVKQRVCWHPGAKWNVSSATKGRSLRVALADGTRLEVMFHPKGAGRSQVTVQHNKIASEKQARAHKRFWAQRLDRLRTLLSTSAR